MNEPRAHRGISRGSNTCTDNDCWCMDPARNPFHDSNKPDRIELRPCPFCCCRPDSHFYSYGGKSYAWVRCEACNLRKELNTDGEGHERGVLDCVSRWWNGPSVEKTVRPPCEVPGCDGLAMVCLKHVEQHAAPLASKERGQPAAIPLQEGDRILTLQELKNAWALVDGDAHAQGDVMGHIRALHAELVKLRGTAVETPVAIAGDCLPTTLAQFELRASRLLSDEALAMGRAQS